MAQSLSTCAWADTPKVCHVLSDTAGAYTGRADATGVWAVNRVYPTLQGKELFLLVVVACSYHQVPNHWHALQAILDNSRSPYAQMLASSSLLQLVTEHTLRYVGLMLLRHHACAT